MLGFLCITASFAEGHHHRAETLTLNLTTLKECSRITMKALSTGYGTEIVGQGDSVLKARHFLLAKSQMSSESEDFNIPYLKFIICLSNYTLIHDLD